MKLTFVFILSGILLLSGGLIFVFTSQAETILPSVSVTLAQCSDGIDNDGDFLIDFPNDPECSSDVDDNENVTGFETTATTTFSFASGGTFTHTNLDNLDVDFDFPADFYTENVRLLLNTYAEDFFESSKAAPSGKSFVGKTYDFILFNASGTQVSSLDKSVTMTLRYKDGDVSGLDEDTVAPYRHDGTDWQLLSGSTLDAANNKITFSTASFSPFTLFGSAATTPSGGGGGGGGGSSPIVFLRDNSPQFPVGTILRLADLNGDGGVNIIDLSILLFYFDAPMPSAARYDLNNDGIVDIIDISILLYYWA